MAHLSGLVVLFCFQSARYRPHSALAGWHPATSLQDIRCSACHDCFAILTFPEKEGFEPSRRFSRPTPFPGEPLRPTWVLLHGRINNGSTVPTQAAFRLSRPLRSRDKSGEDGIRTHVPVKANGFQDRLVMTTSIPLHSM